jgi:hypothetical protein
MTTPTPRDEGQDRPSRPPPKPRGHIGWIVAGSSATGLLAAPLLVAAPLIPAEESAVTGAVLCGLALGSAMLAALSVRFTDQPQRWAVAPALFIGVGGLLLVVFGSSGARGAQLGVAPVMLALAIWMIVRARQQLRSRSRRWLQNHLATQSTNSVHRVVDGATHEMLVAYEERAAGSTQAILDVVSSVRSARPLAAR